ADDGRGDVESALIGQSLSFGGNPGGLGNRDCTEALAELIGEIDEVGFFEIAPVGERDLALLGGELVVDEATVGKRAGVDVDDAGDAAGTRIRRPVGDRAPAGVADEHDLGGDGVDDVDDRVDVVAKPDAAAIR